MHIQRLFDKLTEKQHTMIEEIERRTGAEVKFDRDPDTEEYDVRLVSKEEKYDEDGDRIDTQDELVYIIDEPQKTPFTQEQREKYPHMIRNEFLETGYVSCNKISSRKHDSCLTGILYEMLFFTDLLEMGWHLGREEDFQDPFEPEKKQESAIFDEDYIGILWYVHSIEKNIETEKMSRITEPALEAIEGEEGEIQKQQVSLEVLFKLGIFSL